MLLTCLLSPLSAQQWQVLEPEFPVSGRPSESVLVRLQGPPGAKGTYLKVAGSSAVLALQETESGNYIAEVELPAQGSHALVLGLPAQKTQKTLGNLKVDLTQRWLIAPKELVTRQGPNPDYDRCTPLYAGQKVVVDASRGSWYRCRESGTWVDTADSTAQAIKGGPVWPNRLRRVVVEEKEGDAVLALEVDRCPEVQVEERGDTLRFVLFDTYQTNFDVTHPTATAKFLGPIVLTPQATPRATVLSLSVPQNCGYQILPDAAGKKLRLRIRKPHGQTLNGLKITIDAGHGGPKDPGTVGHGGLAEKELNLRVAKALEEKLRALGAKVVMTRVDDKDVASQGSGDSGELQARVDRSVKADAQLFLSVHHNARPKVEDGKVSHGTDIYWYQPHSEPLARALADPIADAIDEPSRSFRWRSFHVIRQTHSPAVLLEFQYLSNPTLESRVLNKPDYPEKAAQGVVNGLLLYLQSSAK